MSRFINFNGNLFDANEPIAGSSNRSLRYGDGLFESMRWESGRLPLGDLHFDRLFRGLRTLRIECPDSFTAAFLGTQIDELCRQNHLQSARIRLNVFREESAFLFPEHNRPQFVIETAPLPEAVVKPLHITLYREEKKTSGILGNLKTNNFLIYIMAAGYAREAGADDALILNTDNRFCEATSSNVFFIRDGRIYTPSLTEGCVAGVMRRHLLDRLPAMGFSVDEIPFSPELLLTMDEILLTNAIRGLRPVSVFDGRSFATSIGFRLAEEFNAFRR